MREREREKILQSNVLLRFLKPTVGGLMEHYSPTYALPLFLSFFLSFYILQNRKTIYPKIIFYFSHFNLKLVHRNAVTLCCICFNGKGSPENILHNACYLVCLENSVKRKIKSFDYKIRGLQV